ncbi:MAG: UDP-N-acetylmuramate dehydrogenase [Bacteroidales bacterium]|nr:UDP-N-acetylmuramate dehydrogenase [Bacteroidales bacterium]MBN2762079.1 UDP-N-acetylmuramate dehydrogenase [Bacteroidales bacterium]
MLALQENISLQPYNTFGVGAKARWMAMPGSTEEVMDLLSHNRSERDPKFILGGGSNVLFTQDFTGLIIHPRIKGIEKVRESDEFICIRAGCGENWDDLVDYCVRNNLNGLENLSGIPGNTGASPVQNIGAYGVEVKDCIESVEAIMMSDCERIRLSPKECKFSYRDSIFKHELKNACIITYVTYRLSKNAVFTTHYPDLQKELKKYPEVNVKNIREAVITIRKNKLPDPEYLGNAGSFFKNPVISKQKAESIRQSFPSMPAYKCDDERIKLSAAWLIEQCQWKGRKIGRVEAYNKQPLVIVNHGGATGNDVIEYAHMIQQSVSKHFGITLEMEVTVL